MKIIIGCTYHWLIDDGLAMCGAMTTAKLVTAKEISTPNVVYNFCKNCKAAWVRKHGFSNRN
jgi:hypothetical protein